MGVVVVVKAFAEREHAQQPDVGTALRGAFDDVSSFAPAMRDVANGPVTQNAGRHPQRDADGDGVSTADDEEKERERERMQRPGVLEPREPGVAQHVRRQSGFGTSVARVKAQVQVPPRVPQHRVAIAEVVGGDGLVLPEVAHRMEPSPANGPPNPVSTKSSVNTARTHGLVSYAR